MKSVNIKHSTIKRPNGVYWDCKGIALYFKQLFCPQSEEFAPPQKEEEGDSCEKTKTVCHLSQQATRDCTLGDIISNYYWTHCTAFFWNLREHVNRVSVNIHIVRNCIIPHKVERIVACYTRKTVDGACVGFSHVTSALAFERFKDLREVQASLRSHTHTWILYGRY